MADRVYIRAWKRETGSTLADKEIAFVRSAKTLCIGTPDGYIEFYSKDYIDTVVAELNARADALTAKIDALTIPSE